jgi:hypothetical protein
LLGRASHARNQGAPNELDGAALAKAAHIIGMVATILSFLWIVIVIVLIASASASGV